MLFFSMPHKCVVHLFEGCTHWNKTCFGFPTQDSILANLFLNPPRLNQPMFGVQICDVFFWKTIYSLFKIQGPIQLCKNDFKGVLNSTTNFQIGGEKGTLLHAFYTLIDFQITQGKIQFIFKSLQSPKKTREHQFIVRGNIHFKKNTCISNFQIR